MRKQVPDPHAYQSVVIMLSRSLEVSCFIGLILADSLSWICYYFLPFIFERPDMIVEINLVLTVIVTAETSILNTRSRNINTRSRRSTTI